VKCLLFLSDFNEPRIVSTVFEKEYWNLKLYENPFSGSRVVP
jgi:hypothetical protein